MDDPVIVELFIKIHSAA